MSQVRDSQPVHPALLCLWDAQASIGLDEAHLQWGGQSALLSLQIHTLVSLIQKHPHRHTQNSV